MGEPEVALAFTPDPWVEDIHRHLTDHGGARVRSVVIEPGVAVEESYDVLVAGHRWPSLTLALVNAVHERGRAVLGVFDREEPSSRDHLVALGVDALVESDAGVDGFVRAIVATAGRRVAPTAPVGATIPHLRPGRLVTVGGPPGTGRTEVAVQLAVALHRRTSVVLVDADDVAPAVAQRLHLPIEPNICLAIDAVEHGRGELDACGLRDEGSALEVVAGLPNARAWSQVRPGEVLRVVDRLGAHDRVIVADGAGTLEDVGGAGGRGRHATARALVIESDAIVGVCDASPHGVARLLAWAADARALAAEVPMLVVANRAPRSRFRRGELFAEIMESLGAVDVVFAAHDERLADAAWEGVVARKGSFARAIEQVATVVSSLPRPRRQSALVAVP